MSKTNEAARIAMKDVLGLRKGEEVLIISNFEGEVFPIAKALFEETEKLGGKPLLLVQPEKGMHDYADRLALEAMKANPDIIISLSSQRMGKDPYGLKVGYIGRDGKNYTHIFEKLMDGDKRIRGFWSPSIRIDTWERCVPIDYAELRDVAARLKKAFDGVKEVHVTSPAGTNVTISIEGREAKLDDGNFRDPGSGGNLPCGEVYISPAVGKTKGKIVFDGTMSLDSKSVVPKTPVTVIFKDGYVSDVTGGEEAEMLLKIIKRGEDQAREQGLFDHIKNARHLGELGIGINRSAKMVCELLEDEKLGKTVHFAIGTNYDNDANALIHQDCLVLKPSMWIDGKQLMKDGELLL